MLGWGGSGVVYPKPHETTYSHHVSYLPGHPPQSLKLPSKWVKAEEEWEAMQRKPDLQECFLPILDITVPSSQPCSCFSIHFGEKACENGATFMRVSCKGARC